MLGLDTVAWRAAGREAVALGAVALSLPLRWLLPLDGFDVESRHLTPVVFVHGLFGDPTNFLLLRYELARRGVGPFASFAHGPGLDYQRLAVRLGETIDGVLAQTGSGQVDVIGHSLGGLIGRRFTEIDDRRSVRRLVTLAAPSWRSDPAGCELALFGACDPLVAPPPLSTDSTTGSGSSRTVDTSASSITRSYCARWPRI